jgi:hypothetical protein
MPAPEFLSNILPLKHVTQGTPSAFRKGIFDDLVDLVDGGRNETDLYEPFRELSRFIPHGLVVNTEKCSIIGPLVPNLVICDASSQKDKSHTKGSSPVKANCVAYSKKAEWLLGVTSPRLSSS